eukprot:TRINITY_DN842_c0_g1_i1.p1 TRINITY_DN842_c0_g1~~TRINITY_DN842_c0_g1_i1.p1  ORF type:complete len:471 (+),score=104.98 TRINITY_DN842_c0_g1_i1:434-1846(+)
MNQALLPPHYVRSTVFPATTLQSVGVGSGSGVFSPMTPVTSTTATMALSMKPSCMCPECVALNERTPTPVQQLVSNSGNNSGPFEVEEEGFYVTSYVAVPVQNVGETVAVSTPPTTMFWTSGEDLTQRNWQQTNFEENGLYNQNQLHSHQPQLHPPPQPQPSRALPQPQVQQQQVVYRDFAPTSEAPTGYSFFVSSPSVSLPTTPHPHNVNMNEHNLNQQQPQQQPQQQQPPRIYYHPATAAPVVANHTVYFSNGSSSTNHEYHRSRSYSAPTMLPLLRNNNNSSNNLQDGTQQFYNNNNQQQYLQSAPSTPPLTYSPSRKRSISSLRGSVSSIPSPVSTPPPAQQPSSPLPTRRSPITLEFRDYYEDSEDESDDPSKSGPHKRTPKKRLIWTSSLHKLFLQALKELGSDAKPRAVCNFMNVEGLNREMVASHLQKYRNKLRRSAGMGLINAAELSDDASDYCCWSTSSL